MLKKNSLGVGLGFPYGFLGGNIDINIAPNFNLSAGLGSTIFAGMGYSFGCKYFLASVVRSFRPRVSAYYCVNTIVNYGSSLKDNESFTGLNLGLGFQLMWGRNKSNGFDFDIYYIATTSLEPEEVGVEAPGKVKVSLGYRYGF